MWWRRGAAMAAVVVVPVVATTFTARAPAVEVHMVYIINRGKCCKDRLNGFTIYVGGDKDNPSNNAVCRHYDSNNGFYAGDVADDKGPVYIGVYCDQPITGQYVFLEAQGNPRIININEIEVYTPGERAFLGKALLAAVFG